MTGAKHEQLLIPSPMLTACLTTFTLLLSPPRPIDSYLVCVEPGPENAFLPAAQRIADLHGAALVEIEDASNIDALLNTWRIRKPRYVVLVVPPSRIDVDWCHDILESATRIDGDPFIDFQYAFITGRDGDAALDFVRSIERAWNRDFGDALHFMGTWEGHFLPPANAPMSAAKSLGLDARTSLIHMKLDDEARHEQTQIALTNETKPDYSLFFSHGYPDKMVGCYTAPDIRNWNISFDDSVLFNCACYNGAPGRWFEPSFNGFADRGHVSAEDSIALAILDADVSVYFAGVDPWHGPLTNQVFGYVMDDGLSVGAAAKMMYDRLALAFAPQPISYSPTGERGPMSEGTENRRSNGAGMILYGDPAFAPRATAAPRLWKTKLTVNDDDATTATLTITGAPLIDGYPGMLDFMIPQARFMDYYAVKTHDVMRELTMEVYRTVPLPDGWPDITEVSVHSATCNDTDLPTGKPQWLVEQTHAGPVLHVRVPITAPVFGNPTLIRLATHGFQMSLTLTRP